MATSDDPLLAAWYQAMGFEQGSAQTQAQNAEGRIQASHDLDTGRIADLGGRSRTDIQGSMESRGQLFSGETLRRLAQQRQDEGYAAAKSDLGLANQQGTIEDQLASELVRLQAENAQREAEAQVRADAKAKAEAAAAASASSSSGAFG